MEIKPQTKLVTVGASQGDSNNSSVSNDGRYVVFESYKDYDSLFFPGTTNYITDIFVQDFLKNSISIISRGNGGVLANGDSSNADLSGDGLYVVFQSNANNLVIDSNLEDNGGYDDIFLYDLTTNKTRRVNLAYNGFQANGDSHNPKISSNGKYIVFESDAKNLVINDTGYNRDIFVKDLFNNTIKRVSVNEDNYQANGDSYNPKISANGHYVVFESYANNLVDDDNNSTKDIFIRDLVDGTIERININNNGDEANNSSYKPDVSIDGRYVVFESYADNLVDNDTNNHNDIFVRDLITHTTTRVSVANDIFASQSNGSSHNPSITADGRYVFFESDANNLISGDTNYSEDIFVRDLIKGTTKRVSVSNNFSNLQSDASSYNPAISDNGRYISFKSYADNLISNNSNSYSNIFLRDQGIDLNNEIVDRPLLLLSDVRRFYQYEKGFHLYTSDINEIDDIKQKIRFRELAYDYETEKYQVLADNRDLLTGEIIEGVKPIYRFFNTETGAHLYSIDENEKNYIRANLLNYNFEGIKYYAFESLPEFLPTIPVYRMLNTKSGTHLFSSDQNEINYIEQNLPHFVMENNRNAAFYVLEL